MKKFVLGIVWQVLGFLGAVITLCSASVSADTDHILNALDYSGLLIPTAVCVLLFLLGLLVCATSDLNHE